MANFWLGTGQLTSANFVKFWPDASKNCKGESVQPAAIAFICEQARNDRLLSSVYISYTQFIKYLIVRSPKWQLRALKELTMRGGVKELIWIIYWGIHKTLLKTLPSLRLTYSNDSTDLQPNFQFRLLCAPLWVPFCYQGPLFHLAPLSNKPSDCVRVLIHPMSAPCFINKRLL